MVRKPDETVKSPDESAPPPPFLAVMARAEMAMSRELLTRLDAAGYGDQTLAQSRVFGAIPPDGVRLTDLAERVQLTKQAVGELVDQMEEAGYVARSIDPSDARAKLIGFTEKGWQAVDVALAIFGEMEAEIAERVGGRQVDAARQVLETIPEVLPARDR